MKKIIYLLIILGITFTACDPMEDINSEIDAKENAIVGDATITLTDEDYDDLGLSYGNFSSLNDAKTMLPSFLSDLYPYWGKGSSALVGFQLYVGSAPGVSDYTGATKYTFANSDYPGYADNAFALFPDEDPADVLENVYPNATEGDLVLVKYNQYISEPVLGVVNYYDADFRTAQTLLDYEAVSVVGDQAWAATSSYGAKMSGYSSGAKENEDWLISPEIDLTNQTNLSFQVEQAINYASGQLDLINILISSDYDGDVSAATWDTITLTNTPPGTNWTFLTSDDYDLSAYEGKKIHIAFKYQSTASVAATWEVAQVLIKTPGAEGETATHQLYYTYKNGKWVEADGVYYLTVADFDSMGEGSGEPGQYNNFSSSISPDSYLPTFLKLKYPYAMEGDELFVIYPYYSSSSGAQIRGNLYTYTNGAWAGHQSVISTTLQFGHDGNTWVPDNTIKYTLTSADYAYIVSTFGTKYPSETANMASYGNFNGFSWTSDMILEVIGAVLLHNNPSAQEGQKYVATYSIYDGSTHDSSLSLILSGGVYVLQ